MFPQTCGVALRAPWRVGVAVRWSQGCWSALCRELSAIQQAHSPGSSQPASREDEASSCDRKSPAKPSSGPGDSVLPAEQVRTSGSPVPAFSPVG